MITLGKRIRLIRRAVFCFPPGFFARLIGTTPEELKQIENDNLIPSDDMLERVSIITKTTRGWYLRGAEAPTVNNWGYFELPWPGIELLGEAKSIPIADIDDCLRSDFAEGIRDVGPPPCYEARIRGQKWRFVVLPLGSNGAVIFKVGDILWPAMRQGLSYGGCTIAKVVEVTADFASKIGSPRHKHTDPDKVVELFRMLGVDSLSKRWRLDLDTIQDCVWRGQKTEYHEFVAHLAELLNDVSANPSKFELSQGLTCYTRDELDRMRPLAWKEELGLD